MELTINGTVYKFKADIGFMRKAEKRVTQLVQGTDQIKNVGLTYLIAGIIDGDIEDLIDTLDLLNEGQEPRLTKSQIEAYIEDENTDIDDLFDKVLDFFGNANVSKRIVKNLLQKVAQAEKNA